jgi:hypothetical protein
MLEEKAGFMPAFLFASMELLPAAAKTGNSESIPLMVVTEHWNSAPVLPTF